MNAPTNAQVFHAGGYASPANPPLTEAPAADAAAARAVELRAEHVTKHFGGQSFIPETLPKVQQAAAWRKQHGYSYRIEVDGGINNSTAAE